MTEPQSTMISMRISGQGVQWLNEISAKHEISRSELIKRIFRKAAQDYQKGWRP